MYLVSFELLPSFPRLIHLPFLLLSSVRFSEETTYNACLVSPVYNGQPQPLGKMWRRSRHSGTSRLGVEWRSLPLLTDYTFVFVIQIWNVMCFNPYLHICHCHWAYARHNIITKLTNQEFGLSTIVTVSIDICSITDIVWQVSSTGHNHLLLSGEHQLFDRWRCQRCPVNFTA